MFLGSYHRHSINSEKDFPFDPKVYSRFKFGCKKSARSMASELATGFLHREEYVYAADGPPESQIFTGRQVVVISSAYRFVPSASTFLCQYFSGFLNDALRRRDLPPAEETRVHRRMFYTKDYGKLSEAQRQELLQSERFHMDAEFVRGKILLFLDDVRITGMHERVIQNMLKDMHSDFDYMFLYYARLSNTGVAATIEDELNHSSIRDVWGINELIKSGNYFIGVRAIKHILASDDFQFDLFLNDQDNDFLEDLYFSIIGESYHLLPENKDKLQKLLRVIHSRRPKEAAV